MQTRTRNQSSSVEDEMKKGGMTTSDAEGPEKPAADGAAAVTPTLTAMSASGGPAPPPPTPVDMPAIDLPQAAGPTADLGAPLSPTTAIAMEAFQATVGVSGSAATSGPAPVASAARFAPAGAPGAGPPDSQKREQLKAMYLAGFRAAQAKQQKILRDNFNRAQEGQPVAAAASSAAGVHPGAPLASPALIPPEGAPLRHVGSAGSISGLGIEGQSPAVMLNGAMAIGPDGTPSPVNPVTAGRRLTPAAAAGIHRSSSLNSLHSSPGLTSVPSPLHPPSVEDDARSGADSPQNYSPDSGPEASPSISPKSSGRGRKSGGSNPFPKKLMDMLKKEDPSVVGWLPKGDAFIVRDSERFIGDILPRYFRHTKVRIILGSFRCGMPGFCPWYALQGESHIILALPSNVISSSPPFRGN